MSTKPTNTAGPTTNVKVTAILEKANAIRQVRNCPSSPFLFLYVDSLAMHNTRKPTVVKLVRLLGVMMGMMMMMIPGVMPNLFGWVHGKQFSCEAALYVYVNNPSFFL
jgi:hypothetical protein